MTMPWRSGSISTEHDKGITNFHFEVAADLLNEEEIELIRQDASGTDPAGDRNPVCEPGDDPGDSQNNGSEKGTCESESGSEKKEMCISIWI